MTYAILCRAICAMCCRISFFVEEWFLRLMDFFYFIGWTGGWTQTDTGAATAPGQQQAAAQASAGRYHHVSDPARPSETEVGGQTCLFICKNKKPMSHELWGPVKTSALNSPSWIFTSKLVVCLFEQSVASEIAAPTESSSARPDCLSAPGSLRWRQGPQRQWQEKVLPLQPGTRYGFHFHPSHKFK